LLEVELKSNEVFVQDSDLIPTEVGKTYIVTTDVLGIKGKPLSAYFGVDILHNQNSNSDRRIVWLENFSGKKEKYTIIFKAPSDSVRLIYRINKETEDKSQCNYKLLPLEDVKLLISDSTSNITKNYFKERPAELTNDQETILEKNLVWIFASSRSGTTWLGSELLKYQTFTMREPKIDMHLGLRSTINKDLLTEMELNEYRPGYIFSFAYRNTWKYYLRKLILNRIYSQFKNISKKIIIKEPTPGTLGFETIADCFPNSKIIWLLRDGRDVIDSQIDAREHGHSKGGRFSKHDGKPMQQNQRLNFIRNRAIIWIQIIQRMKKTFENHHPDLRLFVRYEDLRKNTIEELSKIYQFLGIDITRNKLEEIIEKYSFENIPKEQKGIGKARRTAKVGGWKENFNIEERDLMNSMLRDTLTQVGYE